MRKRIKQALPKSGRKDEIRRPDPLAFWNEKIERLLKKTAKISKVMKAIGFLVTVGMSIYGLIPKKDELPATDNQRFETM